MPNLVTVGPPAVFRPLLLIFALPAVLAVRPCSALAQDSTGVGALEAGLPELGGVERLRALARLTEAYRSTDPARAVTLGNEARMLADTVHEPEAEVRALNESAWALMELGRYDEAMTRARDGAAVAERERLPAGIARAKNNQGVIQRRLGNFGDALDSFRQALALYEDLDDPAAVATSLNNLSVVLGFDLGDYGRALEAQLQALRIRDDLDDPQALYQSYNTLGVLHHNLRDYDQALEYLGRALDGWRTLDLPPRVAATLNNLAGVYVDRGDLQGALDAQTEALSLRERLASTSGVAFSEESIGNILVAMGRVDEARPHLERALTMRRELGERKNTAASLVSLAKLDRRAGRLAQAQRRALLAAAMADTLQALEVERVAWDEIARIREADGDFEGALQAFRRWDVIDDSLFRADRARRIDALDAEYQAERAEREIERLRAEADLASSTAQRRTAQLLVVVLLGIVGVLLYGRLAGRRNQAELERQVDERTRALRDANDRLQDLSLTDPLTGLRNRRYLFQTIDADLAVSQRAYRDADGEGGAPDSADIVFYLLDLDDFKSVNDQFGHAAGDRVLEQVARVLEDTGRASDVVVRWGGEEFLIVSRGVERAGAAVFAQRVLDAIRGHVFVADEGSTLRRTCSVGFAPYPFVPRYPRSVAWDQVVGLADQAAYVAKRSGRDAWVGVYPTDSTPPELVRGDDTTLAVLAEAGALEIVSSLHEDGRQLAFREEGDEYASRRNA